MNSNSRSIYSIQKVYEFSLESDRLVPRKLGVPANSKGCGGIIDICLMIPESVTVFCAPLGCARHVTTHTWQRSGDMYALAFTESEIVMGKQTDLIEKALLEIYETRKEKPRQINVIGSCIDRLLATDYQLIVHDLKKRIPADVFVTWMDPVIGRKEHPQVRCWEDVILQWQGRSGDQNSVNLFGRLFPPDKESDMRHLLMKAGVGKINYLSECSTIEEFREMGCARLNVVGSKLALKAAKLAKRKFGIPYVVARPTLDPDRVHAAYNEIGKALGTEIDDRTEYEEICQRASEFRKRRRLHPLHAAIGEAYSTNEDAFSLARDAVKLGVDVQYIYSDGKLRGKHEELGWLAENSPGSKVVALSDPCSRDMIIDPPDVDLAWGMSEKLFLRKKENYIDLDDHPIGCDYASIRWFMDMAEAHAE